MVEVRAFNTGDSGSIPPAAVSKFSFTSHCLCHSEKTLNAGNPFYLVSTPGEVKDPTQGTH